MDEPRITLSKLDPTRYYRRKHDWLHDSSATYVDDMWCAGNTVPKSLPSKRKESFEMAEDENNPIQRICFQIGTRKGDELFSRVETVGKLTMIDFSATREGFRQWFNSRIGPVGIYNNISDGLTKSIGQLAI